MRVDWTAESDEEGTIFVRIHPKDQAERELIVRALSEALTEDEPKPATLFAEPEYTREIFGVTDDPEDRTMTLRGWLPTLIINVFPKGAAQ